MSEALKPQLTEYDRRVPDLLPTWPPGEQSPPAHELVSAHQADIRETRQILADLEHLGYAGSSQSQSRRVHVWWRRDKTPS